MDQYSNKQPGNDDTQHPQFTTRKVTPHKVHTSLFRRIVRTIPTSKAEYKEKKVPFFFLAITTIITALFIGWVTFTAYQYLTNFAITDLVQIFSAELSQDEKKRTNILLLGKGGGDHDGADLTDTIIIASLNHTKNSVSMFSLPRDLWVNIPGYGSSRINKIYENLKPKFGSDQALEILKEGVETISNTEIPYVIKINFQAFEDVVDTLGGIEVEVTKSIFDTEYPNQQETGYETFSIEAGTQVLDGMTALKYARSRHSTSDFDRASRQHQIIKAMKQKVSDLDLLSSPLTLKKLYEKFSEHVETNLTTTELITLARFGKNLQQDHIYSAVLKDQDIVQQGSFLYTPERSQYGGAFVLRPMGESFENIQKYISFVFDFPEYLKEKAGLQILNGTGEPGLAFKLGQNLLIYGFTLENYANADSKNYAKTSYYVHRPENTMMTEIVLKKMLPEAIKLKGDPPEGIDTNYDITIIAGKNLVLDEN
ncbi:MAG: LCP family protein [Candidatus Gracilibacteria bacterium]|nr:LCP family protein [Candidatus Gracilibacteria bacterium]